MAEAVVRAPLALASVLWWAVLLWRCRMQAAPPALVLKEEVLAA